MTTTAPSAKTKLVTQATPERPWAGLAEWLRAAHSMLDDKTLTRNADR